MTFNRYCEFFYRLRDKFISEHEGVFNKILDMNLDILGLTPDDKREGLIQGLRDYTFFTMVDGMDQQAELLLGMICEKYPGVGLKIKKNHEKLMQAKVD